MRVTRAVGGDGCALSTDPDDSTCDSHVFGGMTNYNAMGADVVFGTVGASFRGLPGSTSGLSLATSTSGGRSWHYQHFNAASFPAAEFQAEALIPVAGGLRSFGGYHLLQPSSANVTTSDSASSILAFQSCFKGKSRDKCPPLCAEVTPGWPNALFTTALPRPASSAEACPSIINVRRSESTSSRAPDRRTSLFAHPASTNRQIIRAARRAAELR